MDDPDDWRKERQGEADIREAEIADAIYDAAKAIRRAQDALHYSGPYYYPDDRRAARKASIRLGDTVHSDMLAARLLDLVRTAD